MCSTFPDVYGVKGLFIKWDKLMNIVNNSSGTGARTINQVPV